MTLRRRAFLKHLAGVGTLSLLGMRGEVRAQGGAAGDLNGFGVLVDTTACIGCRRCEWACKEQNHLPNLPLKAYEEKSVFERKRRTNAETLTLVNRFPHPNQEGRFIYVKKQCMHCNEPACASACFVKAYTKTREGAVIHHPEVCIGCRYCMAACPFEIPAYQYHDALTPEVTKCTFCLDRITKAGGIPACVGACPMEAMTFGRREDLLYLGYRRITDRPGRYVRHIYGESEVGGTSWMYLAAVPFDRIGFRTDLGTTPIPTLSRGFLSMVSVVLVSWPALCLGFYSFSRRRERVAGSDGPPSTGAGGQP
jgi:Fe-S-cluster-containing dehydrogenase component